MQSPQFGNIALELGYVTTEQLDNALTVQEADDRQKRPHRRLGAILQEMGALTGEQVEAVMERLELQRWQRYSVQGVMTSPRRS